MTRPPAILDDARPSGTVAVRLTQAEAAAVIQNAALTAIRLTEAARVGHPADDLAAEAPRAGVRRPQARLARRGGRAGDPRPRPDPDPEPAMIPPTTAGRRPAPLLLVQTHRTKRDDAMADDDRKLADPKAVYWTTADVAAYWKVKPTTINTYRTRGWLPEPDDRIGNAPVWKPKTIINFKRPGRGARTDLKDGT